MAFFTLVIRRIIYGLILIFAVILLNFFLIHIAPGDPAEMLAGEMGEPRKKLWPPSEQFMGLIRVYRNSF